MGPKITNMVVWKNNNNNSMGTIVQKFIFKFTKSRCLQKKNISSSIDSSWVG